MNIAPEFSLEDFAGPAWRYLVKKSRDVGNRRQLLLALSRQSEVPKDSTSCRMRLLKLPGRFLTAENQCHS